MFTKCIKWYCYDSALETICSREEENGNYTRKKWQDSLEFICPILAGD